MIKVNYSLRLLGSYQRLLIYDCTQSERIITILSWFVYVHKQAFNALDGGHLAPHRVGRLVISIYQINSKHVDIFIIHTHIHAHAHIQIQKKALDARIFVLQNIRWCITAILVLCSDIVINQAFQYCNFVCKYLPTYITINTNSFLQYVFGDKWVARTDTRTHLLFGDYLLHTFSHSPSLPLLLFHIFFHSADTV